MDVVKGKLADAMPLIMAHHYTRRRTADPMHVFLLREHGETVAAAVFTAPVNRYFGKGAVELARLVRTPECTTPMTSLLSHCARWLKQNTELLFMIAYADQTVGHHGGVYQAASFDYVAESKGSTQWRHAETGRIVSGRSFDQSGDAYKQGFERMRTGKKYLYVRPLKLNRKKIMDRFGWQPLPYPKPKVQA
jgi:hypothetical protein